MEWGGDRKPSSFHGEHHTPNFLLLQPEIPDNLGYLHTVTVMQTKKLYRYKVRGIFN
jgi:hypothetical protein